MTLTYEVIDSIVDEVLSRIETNVESLGGLLDSPIIEGDELPELVRIFPSFYVIPLIESGDHISTKISGGDKFHEFSITIAALYKKNTVPEFIRTNRQYAFTCMDLFSGLNQKVSGLSGTAILLDPVVEVGYFRVGDRIIHSWSIKFSAKTITA